LLTANPPGNPPVSTTIQPMQSVAEVVPAKALRAEIVRKTGFERPG
jgi:hypothetical protein